MTSLKQEAEAQRGALRPAGFQVCCSPESSLVSAPATSEGSISKICLEKHCRLQVRPRQRGSNTGLVCPWASKRKGICPGEGQGGEEGGGFLVENPVGMNA